ncbi:MAG: phage tail protein [Desulfovibrionaceae bacterium]|nr:phage tail protein [Desulfovibrionaceae bacterium]
MDKITLRVHAPAGWVDWSYWKSAEITRQIDAISGAFSISLADRWAAEGGEAMPLAAGMKCALLIGKDPVILGYIDKAAPALSASDHGIGVSGRDRSADLVDCSAVHSPGHWMNIDVLRLARELAGPFGVPVYAEGDIGAPIPSFKLEQGETAFEALNRALKLRELLACPDGAGGLALLKVGGRRNRTVLKQGENILAASVDYDLTDRFSDYLVLGQQPGSDDLFGLEASAVHASARDAAVRRYRPLIIRAENAVDSGAAQQRAAWERAVRAARSVTVTVTVPGFRQGAVGSLEGPLWRLNALTSVDIPYLRLRQELLVTRITCRRDDSSGSVTVLELKDPASFRPEPKIQEPAPLWDYRVEAEKDLLARQLEHAERQNGQILEGRP